MALLALLGCWDVRRWLWKCLGVASAGGDRGVRPGGHNIVVWNPRAVGCEKQGNPGSGAQQKAAAGVSKSPSL